MIILSSILFTHLENITQIVFHHEHDFPLLRILDNLRERDSFSPPLIVMIIE